MAGPTSMVELLRALLPPAVGAFLRTLGALVVLALVLAGAAFGIASSASTGRGVVAALIALAVGVAAGVSLAGQRAAGAALLRGLRDSRLGERTVTLLFERLQETSAARTLERLPLAQAEARLREGIEGLTSAAGEGGLRGWLQGKLRVRLLEKLALLTLARFREAGRAEGGVDLAKVRDDLAGRADGLLAGKVRSAMSRSTLILVGVAVLGSLAAAVILRLAA
jgi:hypothetical protein